MPGSDPPDYDALLDADYRAYVARVDAFFPPEIASLPLSLQRERYDEMCRAFHPGRPAGIEVTDHAVPGPAGEIPLRLYRRTNGAPGPRVLFLHGGGFVFGNLDSHDDTCGDLCDRTGLEVISVDYRLAPEHIHPAAFDDAMAAFRWAAASDGPLLLCGESAGGTLAALLAHATRRMDRRPIGQLLIYPQLGGGPGLSRRWHANAPLLRMAEVEAYRVLRAGGQPPDDQRFEPLAGDDFAGLPRTIVVTAECDPLSSEGEAYCRRIVAAGGNAVWREEARLTHSFLRARGTAVRARDAFERLVDDVTALARA